MSEIETILGVNVPAKYPRRVRMFTHGYGYRYHQNVIALAIRLEQGKLIRCVSTAVRELRHTRLMDLTWGQVDWRAANPWFDELVVACIKALQSKYPRLK